MGYFLKQIKDFFSGKTNLELEQSGHFSDDDLKIATAVLLLEMAGVDKTFDPSETNIIFDLIKEQFDLTEEEGFELLEVGNLLRSNRGKVKDFIRALNENFDQAQRELIVALGWKVAMADSAIHQEEENYCARLGAQLGLTKEQIDAARHMAETGE